MKILAGLAALLVAFLGVGYWNATRPPVVVEVALPLPGLAPGTQIRVLQLTDIHVSNPDMPRARLEKIVAQANALKPDLIVLTGDYLGGKMIDWPRIYFEDVATPLAKLRAPLGVYAVLGNHDEPYWTAKLMAEAGSPKLLVNAHADAGPIVVAGVDSLHYHPDMAKALAGIPAEKPVLLLLPEGQQLVWAKPSRPVLALSGDTHGGQIILPLIGSVGDFIHGAPLCRRGDCTINGQRIFVSSGIGTGWIPMRYGVPPEMVLITLISPLPLEAGAGGG